MSASQSRLSAAHLFYAVSLSATATALFGVWGLPIAAFVTLVWWQILSGAQREASLWARQSAEARGERSGKFKLELAVVLVISALLLGLFLPAVEESDPMRHAEVSMQVVAQAVANYERQHGRPLPEVVYDADGKVMHSWRALILRQLDEAQLAAAYRLDEPWNSPNNLRLAELRPWHFQPYYPNAGPELGQTSIQLLRLGTQTFVCENEQAACNWLEPKRMGSEAWSNLNIIPEIDEGFWHRGFFRSKFRGRLAVSTSKVLQVHPGAMSTGWQADAREGFQRSSMSRHEIGEPIRRYHLEHALQLLCFLLVTLYPIRWLKRIQSAEPCAATHRI